MTDVFARAGQQQQSATRQAKRDDAWDRHVRAMREMEPALAEVKRLILESARRRGVMDRIRWIDIGLLSGLWPVIPPDLEPASSAGLLGGGRTDRQRR